jgi:hypothetical protein
MERKLTEPRTTDGYKNSFEFKKAEEILGRLEQIKPWPDKIKDSVIKKELIEKAPLLQIADSTKNPVLKAYAKLANTILSRNEQTGQVEIIQDVCNKIINCKFKDNLNELSESVLAEEIKNESMKLPVGVFEEAAKDYISILANSDNTNVFIKNIASVLSDNKELVFSTEAGYDFMESMIQIKEDNSDIANSSMRIALKLSEQCEEPVKTDILKKYLETIKDNPENNTERELAALALDTSEGLEKSEIIGLFKVTISSIKSIKIDAKIEAKKKEIEDIVGLIKIEKDKITEKYQKSSITNLHLRHLVFNKDLNKTLDDVERLSKQFEDYESNPIITDLRTALVDKKAELEALIKEKNI